MALDLQGIWKSVRPLIYFGWLIALIRFVLEFVAPEQSLYFGVYFVMPLAYLYYGIKGKLDDLPWSRLALAMVMIAFFVWFIPNAISYSTAQFMGWQHGRFSAARGVPAIADTAPGKIVSGVIVSLVTFVGGAVWSIVFSTLLIWLPGRRRKRNLQAV